MQRESIRKVWNLSHKMPYCCSSPTDSFILGGATVFNNRRGGGGMGPMGSAVFVKCVEEFRILLITHPLDRFTEINRLTSPRESTFFRHAVCFFFNPLAPLSISVNTDAQPASVCGEVLVFRCASASLPNAGSLISPLPEYN